LFCQSGSSPGAIIRTELFFFLILLVLVVLSGCCVAAASVPDECVASVAEETPTVLESVATGLVQTSTGIESDFELPAGKSSVSTGSGSIGGVVDLEPEAISAFFEDGISTWCGGGAATTRVEAIMSADEAEASPNPLRPGVGVVTEPLTNVLLQLA
jgi:hypothetical protein